MEEETNDPLGILTKPSPNSDPLGILGDSKKKVPTTSDSSLGGQSSSVGSEKTQPIDGSVDSQLTQIRPSSDSEITRINDFLKTAPKSKNIDVENVNVVEKVTADNNIVTQKATVSGVELTPEDEYVAAAPKAYEDNAIIAFDNAIQRGINQADLASNLTVFGDDPEKATFDEIAKIQAQNRNLRTSESYAKFNAANTFTGAMNEFMKDPVTIVTELTLESMTALLRHGLVRMGAGAVTGGIAGSVIPGAGTLTGAGYGAVAGMGATSLNLEYSGKMMEVFEDMGVDTTDPKQLEEVFSDEKKVAEARSHALKKGIPVAVFDMVSGGIAGKVVSKPAKTLLAKAGGWALETATQSALGAGGELAGQVVAGEDIQPSAIMGEAVGELGGGVGEIAVGSSARQFKRKMDLVKSVGALPVEVNKDEITKNQIALSLVTGEISTEEAADLNQAAQIAVEVDKTIPVQVEGMQRAESLPILIEKKGLERQVALLEGQKETTDPSFHSVIDDQIKVIQEQISEKDNQIKQIITPTQDAETIRSNEGQVQEGGLVGQSSQTEGGENLQQQTPQESGNEKVEVTKETLPSVSKDGLVGMIADGTAEELIKTKQVDPLTFMEQVEKNQLPLPKFLLNMDEAGSSWEQGYYTEEEDARLLELINKAQERSGINELNLVEEKELPPSDEGFKQAGEKSKETQDATHIGRWMLDNSQKGDVIRFSDGGYEVTEVNTKKDGTKELLLTPFTFNEDGSKDYNNPGIFIISEQSIKNGSGLFENVYTNSNGERIVEQSIYEINNTPSAEGTQEAITPQSNGKEVNQKWRQERLLNESTKTEPVSEVEVQSDAEKKIELANQKIDSADNWLKEKLKIDSLPEGTKKMGADTDRLNDLMASGVKHLVSKGIKTSEAIKQIVEYMKEGKFLPKNYDSMVNKLWSLLDEDMEQLWENDKYKLTKDENGALYVRTVNGKEVSKKVRKEVIDKYVDEANFDRGKRAVFNEGMSEERANEHIADTSKNPAEILEALAGVREKIDEKDLDHKETVIADLLRGKISTDSFIDVSDANNLKDERGKIQEGGQIRINYLRKNGKPIDLVAQEATQNSGVEVTPQDIVDFMYKHPKGVDSFWNQKSKDYTMLAGAFFDLTGLHPTQEMIERVKSVEDESNFAGQEPAEKKDEMGSVSESKRKKRRFTKQVMKKESLAGEMKAGISKEAREYDTLPNTLSVAEANSIIQEVGLDAAAEKVRDFDTKMSPGARSVLGQVLIEAFTARGEYEKAHDMVAYMSEQATDMGQFIQAFSLFTRLTPQGQLIAAKKMIKEKRKERFKKDEKKTNKGIKILRDEVKDAADKAVDNVLGKTTEKLATKKSTFASKNKIFTREKIDKARAALRKSGGFYSNPFNENVITIVGGIVEDGVIKFKDFAVEAVAEFGSKAKPILKDLYKAAQEQLVKAGVIDVKEFSTDEEIDSEIATMNANDKAIRDEKIEKALIKKFEIAQKTNSEKLFKEALAELSSLENPASVWNKYKSFAEKRIKTMAGKLAGDVLEDAQENPALMDFVNGLVKNINTKLQEGLTQEEKDKLPQQSAIKIIADAFKNIEKYGEVLENVRKELQKEYADKPEALAVIDEKLGAILDEPFSKKLVEKSVDEIIGKRVSEIVNLENKGFDTSSFEDEVIEKLIYETGLSEQIIKEYINLVKEEISLRKEKENSIISERKKKIADRKNKIKESRNVNKPLWESRREKAISATVSKLEKRLFESLPKQKTAVEEFANRLISNIGTEVNKLIQTKDREKKVDNIQLLIEVLKNEDKYKDVIEATQKEIIEKYKDNPNALMQFDDALFKISSSPFYSSMVEKSVKEAIKSLDFNVAKIAKAHFTEFNAAKNTLVEKLMTDADLPQAEAEKLAKALSDEFHRIIMEKKQSIIDNLVKEKVVKKKEKINFETELTKLLNLGAFSDKEFLDSWAKANDYPELTEENIKEIKRLADIVESFKDKGNEKFRAIEDLLAYQARIKNISLGDVAQAIWYAHVLSGYKTHLVNALSNSVNSFAEFSIQLSKTAVTNPKGIEFLAKGWWNGFMNGLLREGLEVIRTGYNPIRGKIEIPATLEIVSKNKPDVTLKNAPKLAIWGYANMAKYVRRVMVATDVVFYEGLKEMKAYQLAASMAKEEKKLDPSIDIRNKALEILNKTDPQYQAILNTAHVEYQQKVKIINNGNATKSEKERLLKQAERDEVRRVYELTQLEREGTIQEAAQRFAARGTFNYKPEGLLGRGVELINNANNRIPALRYIIPFTNIVANVANETLNYTPYGALRATMKERGGHVFIKKDTPLTPDERADLLLKSTIGVVAMTIAMMLSTPDDDDNKPTLEITGGATGDFKKNYNLKDWLPYSYRVKNPKTGEYSPWISYQNSPLYLALAYIGNLRDLEKYRGVKLGESEFKKYRMALSNTKTLFLNMTFLSTMNTFLNDVFNSQGGGDIFDKSIKNLANVGKGFVVPNAWSQFYKDIEIAKDIPIKEATLALEKPETWFAPILKDIPVARNIYFDKIDALGDPIIPTSDRFVKFKNEVPKEWETIAKYKMMNLFVPSIKTVTLPDPKTLKQGDHQIYETVLTDQEYFDFCKLRGGYIKTLLKDAPENQWDVMNKEKRGSGDKAAQEWMTSVQKKATEYAKNAILTERLTKSNP